MARLEPAHQSDLPRRPGPRRHPPGRPPRGDGHHPHLPGRRPGDLRRRRPLRRPVRRLQRPEPGRAVRAQRRPGEPLRARRPPRGRGFPGELLRRRMVLRARRSVHAGGDGRRGARGRAGGGQLRVQSGRLRRGQHDGRLPEPPPAAGRRRRHRVQPGVRRLRRALGAARRQVVPLRRAQRLPAGRPLHGPEAGAHGPHPRPVLDLGPDKIYICPRLKHYIKALDREDSADSR